MTRSGSPEPADSRAAAPVSQQVGSTAADLAWVSGERVAFRFTFVLVLVFSMLRLVPELFDRMPVPFGSVAWFETAASVWNAICQGPRAVLTWLALPVPISRPGRWPFTGTGQNILIDLLIMLLVVTVLAVVFSYVDRRRRHYRTLHEALRIYLRFALAVLLIHYGWFKLLLNQGDYPPAPSRMLMPWGMFAPQEIPITMLGAGPLYQMFAGAVELLGGVLLVFRRTARLGALVAAAAAANVAALNLGYHMTGMAVLSVSMFVMATLLVIPDVARLAHALLSDRPLPARAPRPFFAGRYRRVAQACGLIFLFGESGYIVHGELTTGSHWRGRPPLYGAYDVETFVRGRDTIPPLLTDTTRWLRFAVDPSSDPLMRTGNAYAYILRAHDIRPVALRVDSVRHTITVVSFGNRDPAAEWTYTVPDEDHVVLLAREQREGQSAQPLHITLRRIDLGSMRLLQPRAPW